MKNPKTNTESFKPKRKSPPDVNANASKHKALMKSRMEKIKKVK